MKIFDIVAFLREYEYEGDLNRSIESVSTLENPKKNTLIFCKEGYRHKLGSVRDSLVVLRKDDISALDDSNAYIVADNPRLTFLLLVKRFFADDVDVPDITIHPSVSMGAYVTIEGRVEIGRDVNIQSHVSIGTAGFGYERSKKGVWQFFPQVGGVIIEDDVDIASGACIHRGTIDDTIIRQGSKISVHCNVGHNSIVGRHTFMAAKSNLGGKTEIGDYCFIGMGVVTKPGIKIGNNVIIGMGSIVMKDIGSNCIVYGFPAEKIKENPVRYGE